MKPKRIVRAKNLFSEVEVSDGGALWRQDRKWMYLVNPTYKKVEQKLSDTDRLMLEKRREQRVRKNKAFAEAFRAKEKKMVRAMIMALKD